MTTASRWPQVAEALVAGLTRAGTAGVLTAPATFDTSDQFRQDRRTITAMLAFTMDPPVQAGPFNPAGIPVPRRGLPHDLTERVTEAAVRWAAAGESRGQLGGGGPVIPAIAEDAAELVTLSLAAGQQHVRATFVDDPAGGVRQVNVEAFGQVADVDVTHAPGPDVALGLGEALRRQASLLDGRQVGPTSPAFTGATDLDSGPRWIWNRHLWSSRVHDAYGIQLLTRAHLDHAHDLSGWQVARDRWLVSARDLRPWYDVPDFNT